MRSQATAANPVKRSVMTYDGLGRRTTKVIIYHERTHRTQRLIHLTNFFISNLQIHN